MEEKKIEEIVVDGTLLEGGGQIFRMSIALSLLTNRSVKVINIRGKRPNPGLANQHLCGLNALAEMCGAYVSGNYKKSSEVSFCPGSMSVVAVRTVKCDSAGSAHLILQMLLPNLVFCPVANKLRLSGGTDTSFSPTSVCVKYVLFPLLKQMGINIEYKLEKRGFFPLGGGRVCVNLEPFSKLLPLQLKERGALEKIAVYSVCTLSEHEHFHKILCERLKEQYPTYVIYSEIDNIKSGFKKGKSSKYKASYVVLSFAGGSIQKVESYYDGKGEYKNTIEIEKMMKEISDILSNENVTLDEHHSDQVLVYMALASGLSTIRVRTLSLHFQTMLHLLPQFLKDLKIRVAKNPDFVEVEIEGINYKPKSFGKEKGKH